MVQPSNFYSSFIRSLKSLTIPDVVYGVAIAVILTSCGSALIMVVSFAPMVPSELFYLGLGTFFASCVVFTVAYLVKMQHDSEELQKKNPHRIRPDQNLSRPAHTSWLEESEIYTYILYLKYRHPEVSFSIPPAPILPVEGEAFYRNYNDTPTEQLRLNDLENYLVKLDPLDKDPVVLPLNIGGGHWTLVYVDRLNLCFEYYDSLCNLEISERVNSLAKKLGYNFVNKVPFIIQNDSYQCGVWLLLFLRMRLETSEFELKPNDGGWFKSYKFSRFSSRFRKIMTKELNEIKEAEEAANKQEKLSYQSYFEDIRLYDAFAEMNNPEKGNNRLWELKLKNDILKIDKITRLYNIFHGEYLEPDDQQHLKYKKIENELSEKEMVARYKKIQLAIFEDFYDSPERAEMAYNAAYKDITKKQLKQQFLDKKYLMPTNQITLIC